MFHKYDFGTASQITSRRCSEESAQIQAPLKTSTTAIIFIEVCAIVALCLFPHGINNFDGNNPSHKVTAHVHHNSNSRHVG